MKIKTNPFPYQQEAVERALKWKRHLLVLPAGAGKTSMSLSLIDKIKERKQVKACIVLSPKTALVTWKREILKHSNFTFSINDIDFEKDINVVSFPRAGILEKIDLSSGPSLLIIDECHVLGASDTDIAKELRRIIHRFDYAFGMTATPAGNHIEELFFLVNSFFPGFFPSYQTFMDTFTVRRERVIGRGRFARRYQEVVGYNNLDKLSSAVSEIMYRYCISYPVEFVYHSVTLSTEEWEVYRRTGKGFLRKSYRDFVARLPDLQQIVNGSINEEGQVRYDGEMSSKERFLFDELVRMYEEGKGVIVFTSFLSTMKRFRKMALRLPFDKKFFLSGESDVSQREFISSELVPGTILFSTMVGGVSLNLQAVNNVVFYDIPWSLKNTVQCLGRITRVDSTFDRLNVIFIIAEETIDKYKTELFRTNADCVNQIFGGFGFLMGSSSVKKKSQIVRLRKSLLWGKG